MLPRGGRSPLCCQSLILRCAAEQLYVIQSEPPASLQAVIRFVVRRKTLAMVFPVQTHPRESQRARSTTRYRQDHIHVAATAIR